MTDTMIMDLLLSTLRAHLLLKCQTALLVDDPEYADVVEIGRFQDDPVKKNVHIAIQGGYLEKPNYMDGIVTLEEFHRIGMYIPPREVGGGQMWWRRGSVEVGCFFIGTSLTEAQMRTAAYNVLGRVTSNLDNIAISGLSDSFGEKGYQMQSYASEYFQGGGPPNQYIWRGRVLWQALTERVKI